MSGKRSVSFIIAVCFMITGLFAIPSFASDNTGTDSTGPASDITDSSSITSGSAIGITGSAITTSSDAINTSNSALGITGAAISTSETAVTIIVDYSTMTEVIEPPIVSEKQWYLSQIPMKKEHQKLLWDYCKERGIEYVDMLALISLESNFSEKCSSGKHKGYFQISTIHHKNLAATLKTANKPLDGAVNINWGTAMYSWILADKRLKGLKDKTLRDAALSIYQRGAGGYDRYGINKKYLALYYKKRDILVTYLTKGIEQQDHPE